MSTFNFLLFTDTAEEAVSLIIDHENELDRHELEHLLVVENGLPEPRIEVVHTLERCITRKGFSNNKK